MTAPTLAARSTPAGSTIRFVQDARLLPGQNCRKFRPGDFVRAPAGAENRQADAQEELDELRE
jgi:hypothetical protein